MAGHSGLAGAVALMFSGTLLSRVLGLARNALMVAALGLTGSGAANAFSVANKLPNIIFMLLAGGILNAVLVPQIVRAMRSKDGGTEYVNRLLTFAAILMGIITLILTAASGALVTLYAADLRNEPWMPVAVAFAMWCIPQLFFYGLYTLLGQLLNARSNFGPYTWAPALNNVISIAGLTAYLIVYGKYAVNPAGVADWDAARIAMLAGPWTLGVILQALILMVPLYRSGFRYRPTFGLRNTGLGSAGRVAKWAFAALTVGQVGYLAVSNLAASAGARGANLADPDSVAGNAAYDNAFLIFMLPQSLITVSLVTAMFTRLSEHATAGHAFRVRDDLSRGLRTLAVFTVFAAGAFMVLAIPLTQMVTFGQSEFSSYRAVAQVLVALLFGLPALAVWTMTQRVYFAFEDARSLFWIQVPMAAIQMLGSVTSLLLLPVQWWVASAGAATALSNIVGALVAYLGLRRKLPNLDGTRVLRTHVRVLVAVVPTTLLGWLVLHLWGVHTTFVGATVRVVVLGGGMTLLYLLLLRRLRVAELDNLLQRIGAMLAPITGRLAPMTNRIALPGPLRTMWTGVVGETGNGDTPVTYLTPDLEPGAMLADRYLLRIERTTDLPEATEWSGRDEILQRSVLLTVLHGSHREEALDAARRVALLTEPRLRRILRVGSADGVGFVVSEPTLGQSLAELTAHGRLPADQARALVGEAATALETARKRGIHHLRLRPSVLQVSEDGDVHVLGLGVDAAQAGTASLAPRQAARQDAVDLVSLTYTALTGYWPGDGVLAGDLPLAPRHDGVPVLPGDLVDDVPHDLDTLCAVTFGPHQDGPFTPGELVRELEPWTSLTAVTTLPGPTTPVIDNAAAATEPTESDHVHQVRPQAGGPDRPDPDETGADQPGEGGSAADKDTPGVEPSAGVSAGMVTGAAGFGAAVITTPDSSDWAPQPPPENAEPASFDTVLNSGEPVPSSADYSARHAGHTHAMETAATERAVTEPEPAPTHSVAAPAAALPARLTKTVPTKTTAPTLGWDVPAQTHSEHTSDPAATVHRGEAAAVGSGASMAGFWAKTKTGLRARFITDASQGEDGKVERFNPTPIVIFVMVAVVVVAMILAIGSLRDAATSFDPDEHTRPPVASPSETTAEPAETATPTQEPNPDPTQAEQIALENAQSLDPSSGVGDNEDQARYAIDGKADTTWNSLRYENPKYGMKEGLGFAVTLKEKAKVTEVTVDVQGSGGVLQIRETDAKNPGGGKVLAEGEMGPKKTYTLSTPTELETVVLWFPELPVAESDGQNRIELAEITVT